MVQIYSLGELLERGIEIRSLEEVATKSSKPKVYQKWFDIERNLIENGKAVNLESYFLQEYQFNKRSTLELGEELGFSAPTIKGLLFRLGIPIRNFSEAGKGREITQEWREKLSKAKKGKKGYPISEEQKKKLSEERKGKARSPETIRKMSEYMAGRYCGEANPHYGKHHSEDAKRRISEARFGKPLSIEHRESISKSLRNLPKEILVRGAMKGFNHRAYNVEGRFYAHSQEEGAVALLLEKYLSNYQVTDGKNFQVRGNGIYNGGIDFLVNGEFLEWHPIIVSYSERNNRGDILTRKEERQYKKSLEDLTGEEKKGFIEEYKKELANRYLMGRQEDVDNSEYKGANVTIARDVKELYDFISKHPNTLPEFEKFESMFKEKIKYVKTKFKVEKENKTDEPAT